MTTSTYINAHKALVIPIVLSLMLYYNNWSVEAFLYLAIHGTYTVLWLIKQGVYPDRRFSQPQPLGIGITFIFVPLAGYYIAPYLLISRHVTLPPYICGLVVALFTVGVFLHFVSDAQKFYTLQLQPGLIMDGLFARTRNPNYLGEILIYVAFGLMSRHWLPFAVLAAWVVGFFLRNMIAKDRSLSRFPAFRQYKHNSGLLLPRLWRRVSQPAHQAMAGVARSIRHGRRTL
jgi:protein-S-isoprenylcysteine O-methyltransferase Ste14